MFEVLYYLNNQKNKTKNNKKKKKQKTISENIRGQDMEDEV